MPSFTLTDIIPHQPRGSEQNLIRTPPHEQPKAAIEAGLTNNKHSYFQDRINTVKRWGVK
ncbi:hypothetical protein E2C01_007530 [Portunus trituberculatus]|uniref:Uncharacterized protein n=1 Tax=Portunus trituberculatus TaxID=210409 RepID=A0A5B7CY56_PORTR|nr:hypothetical protein [Portunus trituberculatus]